MAAGKKRLRWYHVQLFLAASLQTLTLFAPLSFGGNWEIRQTGFLHPLWVATESFDTATRETSMDIIPAYLRPELLLLSIWMGILAGFLWWTLFQRASLRKKINQIGNSFGGFALQVIIAFFVARTISWHIGGGEAELEIMMQREFFLLLFPVIFAYLARQRMRVQQARDELASEPLSNPL